MSDAPRPPADPAPSVHSDTESDSPKEGPKPPESTASASRGFSSEMRRRRENGPGPFLRTVQGRPFRTIVMGILILVMLIPLSMVESVVRERERRYDEVLKEIGGHWGLEQMLVGPILVMPYTETYTVTDTELDENDNTVQTERRVEAHHRAVILPKTLRLEGTISPTFRKRDLYTALVYSEQIVLSGHFENIDGILEALVQRDHTVAADWDDATIVVGLSDPKGITRIKPLQLNGRAFAFSPGTRFPDLVRNGFHAPLRHSEPVNSPEFNLEMAVNGSEGFKIAPIGELTEMVLSSSWAHPSFYGDILPVKRSVDAHGFSATWSIPHLVRSFPQFWIQDRSAASSVPITAMGVGVRLFEPVTIYTKAIRAVKYGVLFIALTFLSLALLELVTRSRPTMVQYVIVGAAISLFYLLLVALSEHLGFDLAYLMAAATVVILNTLYCSAFLSRKMLSLVVMAVLSGLYGVLFLILRSEDHALLAGTLLLLVALAVTMFFTRNLHKRDPQGTPLD